MISAENAARLRRLVEEVARLPPDGWTKVVQYIEFVDDEDGLSSRSMEEYWIGDEQHMELAGSAQAASARDDFYRACAASGQPWTGMRLEILASGTYRADYFYTGTPLVDEDYDAAEARMAAPAP
jgi:hypothetical protein